MIQFGSIVPYFKADPSRKPNPKLYAPQLASLRSKLQVTDLESDNRGDNDDSR